jgi:hypothetical protein
MNTAGGISAADNREVSNFRLSARRGRFCYDLLALLGKLAFESGVFLAEFAFEITDRLLVSRFRSPQYSAL